jgi:hypothetical protein
MKDLKAILEQYEKIETGDYLAIIDFVQLNSDYLFSGISKNLSEIEHIYIDYLISLYDKSRYSKVLEVVDIMEKSNDFIEYRKIDTEFDEDVRYHKYASMFLTKKYRASKFGFAELVKDFPDNENYPNWLKDSKFRTRMTLYSLILFSSIGLSFLTLVLRHYLKLPIPKIIGSFGEGIFLTFFVILMIDWYRNKE